MDGWMDGMWKVGWMEWKNMVVQKDMIEGEKEEGMMTMIQSSRDMRSNVEILFERSTYLFFLLCR